MIAAGVTAVIASISLAPAMLAQDGKSVVVLMPTRSNNYLAEWIRGAEEEATRQGIDLTIIENNFDQAEQDVQVQQQIAAGTAPDAYVWWPADNNAGVASLQALAATGVPVVQTNQLPAEAAEGAWVAYVGVDDVLNGTVAGELLVDARDALVEAGTLELSSEGGNAIAIKFIEGYQAADDRMTGFHSVADPAGITLLAEEAAGFDAQTGYTAAQGLITANRDAGIDLVYAQNDNLAVGAIQALEEAGYSPGEDVAVVGGTCHGNLDELRAGKQYGTGLQAAFLEGLYTINAVARYLADPTVLEGSYNEPATPDAFPEFPAQISQYNFIPNPPVLSTELDTTNLWGSPLTELCVY
jgi:ribose transport system substrate-binding protein